MKTIHVCDHSTPEALYPFDARGVAKRFRHAAIFGALDALLPGMDGEVRKEAAKIFKKHPSSGSNLKQFGMATGFFASATD